MAIACVVVTGLVWAALSRTTVHARHRLRGDDPEIEVLLTALDGAPKIAVGASPAAEWIATDAAGAELARGTGKRAAAFEMNAAGRIVLDGRELAASDVTVASSDRTPLTAGTGSYRGAIRVSLRKGALRATNRVPMESYLASVVGSEMYARSTKPAALEAQAIAARTYAYWAIDEQLRSPLPDSTAAQRYLGLSRETASTRAAVLTTRGIVLTSRGKILPSYFHSSCGGRTQEGSFFLGFPAPPPLRGVLCGFCNKTNSRNYQWGVDIPNDALGALAVDLKIGTRVLWLAPKGPNNSRWTAITLSGDSATIPVSGFEFYHSLNRNHLAAQLPSPNFQDITSSENGIHVLGTGQGHGVGLCQSGAAEMARRAFGREEILKYYFPGAELNARTDPPK